MKIIEYFIAPGSPWTYLGHGRLLTIAERHRATIELKPFDLAGKVFPVSGGLPVPQRSPQRQAYRLVELRRWPEVLGLPLNPQPRYFPVPPHDAARLIIIADKAAGTTAALALAGRILSATWADERDISNPDTLAMIAGECGLDGAALLARLDEADTDYRRFTQQAIDRQVFGAPWYVYRGEPFWGQDRLDLLDRALARD